MNWGLNSILQISEAERSPKIMNTKQTGLPGLIELGINRSELHGFEVDMSGRVIVPEFHPRSADELSAYIKFESELREAIDAAA
jgi:hypothetical protein